MDAMAIVEQSHAEIEAVKVAMEKYRNLSREAHTMMRLGMHMGIQIGRRLEQAEALQESLAVSA